MSRLSWWERKLLRYAERQLKIVPVQLWGRTLKFRGRTEAEIWRARSAMTKEAGTVEWIADSVKPGDVFCDIGANIGLYSLMAALKVGAGGTVYAFEPHGANFGSLLDNIALNGFEQIVRPFSCALHDREGLFDFNYQNLIAGSSMSQLDATRDADEREFTPAIREGKLATTLDQLIDYGLEPPTHVKIDVDGNELLVLRGMRGLLAGERPPATLQVEINQRYKQELEKFLSDCGYEQYHRHDTELGLSKIAGGADPASVAHNALFRPRLRR